MYFTGTSEHSIDAKHRLAIPAKIRAGLDPDTQGDSFYITRGSNGGLWLWPQRTFERIAGELEPSLAPAPQLMEFDEITFPEAQHLDIDAAGRIRIPEEMLSAAGLGSRAVLLGNRHHLEIWDPQRWAAYHDGQQQRRDEIIESARDVMPPPSRGGRRGAAE